MSDKLSWNDVLAVMMQENLRDSIEHDIGGMIPENEDDGWDSWTPQEFDDEV